VRTGATPTLSSITVTVTDGVTDGVVSPTIGSCMVVSGHLNKGTSVLEGGWKGAINAGGARARPVVGGKSASGGAGTGAVTTVTPAVTPSVSLAVTPAVTPSVTSVDRQTSARATGTGAATVTTGDCKGDGDRGEGGWWCDGNDDGDRGDSGCVTVTVAVTVVE
jgi:hypothetical protein